MAIRSSRYNIIGLPGAMYHDILHENSGDKKLIDRMWSLHSRYCMLLGYLYDENGNLKEKKYPPQTGKMMAELKLEIDNMFSCYNDVYEGDTCGPQEKEFLKVLRAVKERVFKIVGVTGMVDKVGSDSEGVDIG